MNFRQWLETSQVIRLKGKNSRIAPDIDFHGDPYLWGANLVAQNIGNTITGLLDKFDAPKQPPMPTNWKIPGMSKKGDFFITTVQMERHPKLSLDDELKLLMNNHKELEKVDSIGNMVKKGKISTNNWVPGKVREFEEHGKKWVDIELKFRQYNIPIGSKDMIDGDDDDYDYEKPALD